MNKLCDTLLILSMNFWTVLPSYIAICHNVMINFLPKTNLPSYIDMLEIRSMNILMLLWSHKSLDDLMLFWDNHHHFIIEYAA